MCRDIVCGRGFRVFFIFLFFSSVFTDYVYFVGGVDGVRAVRYAVRVFVVVFRA